jgi:hypothetical protein
MSNALGLWNRWCSEQLVIEQAVPLFSCDESLVVRTRMIGSSSKRPVLCRHENMEKLVLNQVNLLNGDWSEGFHDYDGLIYLMFVKVDENVVPLYIGKAETFGKGDRNLSVNLRNIHTDRSKFARWGDNYQYHIGDLSAAVLSGHASGKVSPKYEKWARALFEDLEQQSLRLRKPVYFWTKAWKPTDRGIWAEMNPTRLTFLEYLLIGVASAAFGMTLLNNEGHNR